MHQTLKRDVVKFFRGKNEQLNIFVQKWRVAHWSNENIILIIQFLFESKDFLNLDCSYTISQSESISICVFFDVKLFIFIGH